MNLSAGDPDSARSTDGGPVWLINPFRVFDGHEAAFLALWEQTGALFAASPGFLGAELVVPVPAADQAPRQTPPFTHVNLARWASPAAYRAALANPALAPLAAQYRAVSSYQPALYRAWHSLAAASGDG